MWAGGKGKGKVVRVESNNDHSSSLSQSHQSSASNVASTSESTSLSYQAATAATVNHDGLETSSFGFRKSIVPGLSTKKDPVRLYVCDGCFKYTLESVSLSAHLVRFHIPPLYFFLASRSYIFFSGLSTQLLPLPVELGS